MVSDCTQIPDNHWHYVQMVTRELSSQVGAKFPILGQLLGSSFYLERVPCNYHLDEIQSPGPLVLEKDVWMTGHNIFVRGDGDLCVLVFRDWQRFNLPPLRRDFKAVVLAEVIIDH